MQLTGGVAMIFFCCTKLVFMVFTTGLWHRELKHYIFYCLEKDSFKTE